ncbi:MAG: DNA repair protein RecO, partial [Rhodobacteraceae bacterium]|nr:DNA repair protein RecO [Paracoccaceae bacterium]
MEWTESGVLLTCRPHGETTAIAHILARENGRYAGIVHGATRRHLAPTLQPGNHFKVKWRARTVDNLGWFVLEQEKSRSVAIWNNQLALAGMTAACALLDLLVPERMAYPALYDATIRLLDGMMEGNAWQIRYGLWEKHLIETIGFGLELDRCAVTGSAESLIYVSPRTGRAV